MKKLFISCPMKDRTEAQIRGTMMQMHRIAEAVFGEELEVIQTYIPDPPSGMNQALWCLGESIKMLSEADYFIGIYDEEKAYRGCAIENQAAKTYGIPSYTINLNRYTDKEFFDIDNLPARYFFSNKVFCVNNIANF